MFQKDLYHLSCWNYGHEDYDYTYPCNTSEHKEWLINGQEWWYQEGTWEGNLMYFTADGLEESTAEITDTKGIRPIITISKDYLEGYIKENS